MCFCCLFLLGQETWPPSEVPEIQVTQTSGAPTSIVELNVVNNVAFFVPYQRPGDTTMTALVNGEQTIELVVVDAYEARLPVPWFDISETQMMDVTIDDVTVQIQVDPPPAVADVPALVAELKTKTTQVLELMKVRTELAAVEAPANEHLRVQLAMDILVTWKDDFNTQMDLLLTRSPAEQQAIASVFQASDLLSVYDDYLAVSAGDDPDCSEFGKLVELEGYFDKGSAVTKAATSIALVIKGLCLVTGFPCIAVDTVSNIGSGLAIGSAVGDVVTPSQGDMEAYTPEPNLDLAGEAGIIDVTADLNTRDNDLADLWNIIGGILGRVSWTTNETVSYGYDVFLDAAGTQIPDYDADFVIREEFDLPVDVTKLISEMDPNGVVGLENGEFCNRLRVNPLQVGDVDIKLVFPSFTVPLESNTLHFIVVNAPLVERLTGIANGTYEGSMFNIHGDLGTYKVRIAGTQQDVDPCNPRVEISGADTDNATITVRGCHHEFIGQGSGSVRLAWVKANGQQRIPLESVSWQYSSGFADGGAGDNGYAETYLGRQDHGLVTYINGGTLMMGGEKICLFGPSDGSFQGSMYLGARALSDYHGERS